MPGVARNPHVALLYTGVGFRQHQFDYRIICRSDDESKRIQAIIKKFKEAMSPDFVDGEGMNVFDYPHLFRMSFSHPEFLYDFHPCALIGFNVNYHGQGFPAYYADTNAPYEMILSLQFQETLIVTRKDVIENNM